MKIKSFKMTGIESNLDERFDQMILVLIFSGSSLNGAFAVALLHLLMTHRFATDEKRKRQHFQIFWSQPSDFLVCANFQSHITLRQHPPRTCFVKTSKTLWFKDDALNRAQLDARNHVD